ncbi:ImmA/IrrE family metallo-endopeptidase, partial [Anaerosalibacter bizertensis]
IVYNMAHIFRRCGLIDAYTIFIDKSLLDDKQMRRERFTLGHEIGHWLLHKSKYSFNPNQLSFFYESSEQLKPIIKCRTSNIESTRSFKRELISDEDWLEWQADYLASAFLMPKSTFIKVTNEKLIDKNITQGYYEYGYDKGLDLWIDSLVSELADIFDVSLTAAKIRLKNLRLIREKSAGQQSFI